MEKKILFVAVVFGFAAEAAMAIKCYQCDYQESKGITAVIMASCKDKFKANGMTTISNDPVTGDPCKFCTKIKTSRDDTDTFVYQRTCSSLQQTEDCGSGEFSGVSKVCFCKTDFCNSGNVVMMSFCAIALATVTSCIFL
ncbi:uncharacterized protein LOC128239773 isoform X1 [Mya arenaria]|uniref:uncharacterized protein LOC128239773 isoform X1 n=1 Tax=Mya arenaria TaxID=6604 RepID=UPI0022E886C4|nr:uncharacterized protein LOC128239773 isoform X1 [Mya arenaria]